MDDEITLFTEALNKELKELYEDENYGIDPLTIIMIINLIYNIYKAIMVIYFPKNEQELIGLIKNPSFLVRIIIGREIRKNCKNLRSDDQDVAKKAFISIIRQYGDDQLSKLISQVKEKKK